MSKWRGVSIEEMNAAREADAILWREYISTIHPDERQYLPYQKWLAAEVERLRMYQSPVNYELEIMHEDAFDREERHLEELLASGRIDNAEYRRQLQELHRDYRNAAHQAAQDAYDLELGSW